MAQLEVTVLEGRNFAKKDLLSESDPFVRLYLDDKNEKQITKVEYNSATPHWNQIIVFNHLHGQDNLHVDVYDKDPFKNDKIGSLIIDLRDLYEQKHIDNWYTIISRFRGAPQGEIHLILKYEPLKV